MSTSSPVKRLAPLSFPTSGFKILDTSEKFEEETLPGYEAWMFYPAHIGEVLNDRYQLVGKLGFGTTSTVWLARDLVEPDDPGYVAVKIYVTGKISKTATNEIAVYDRIKAAAPEADHAAHDYIRRLLSSFDIKGPRGTHKCLVHEVMGTSLDVLLDWFPGKTLELEALKAPLRQIIVGLNFLETQAGIIHTDLQPKNLILPVTDRLMFQVFEDTERETQPAPRKILDDRTIYLSQIFPLSATTSPGLPRICDFGEARFAEGEHREDIMPNQYRAPEVTMQMKWDQKVDIWSIAMVAWDLVSPRTLFQGRNPETNLPDDRYLIAELAALLGPPPPRFMQESKVCPIFWDENGNWKDVVPLPDITLDSLASDIRGEDKEGFLRFLRRILRWLPEERPTTDDLVIDPWMLKGFELTDEEMEYARARNRELGVLMGDEGDMSKEE